MSSKNRVKICSSNQSEPVGEEAADHVDPEPFRNAVAALRRRIDQVGLKRCWWACEIMRVVHDNVSYDHSIGANFNRGPVETWDQGGNCVDQSVLLASMLKAAGFRCRLTTVTHGQKGHMYLEVFFDAGLEELKDSINDYLSAQDRTLFQTVYGYTEVDNGVWMIADPTCSRFIGDAAGVYQEGYTAGFFDRQEV